MSDTPKPVAADAYETMEALLCEIQGLRDELADVKRERDEAREDLEEEMKFHHRTHGECVIAQCELMDVKNERDEARVQFGAAEGLGLALVKTINELKKERDEQTAQMCQAIGYLSTVAEDCEAWLKGESDEPSMDFIKAVRDYARKAL